MKKTNIFLLIAICIFLQSCNTISQGFKSPKQNKSDEFLVEKKSPLKFPPDYDQLPTPLETNNEEIEKESSIEEMIKVNKNETKKSNSNSSLEELVLDKIKSN